MCFLHQRFITCRFWDKLTESATHPTPSPWYPPSSRPTDTAYTVASPPPTSPRKPWEGTLREIAPQQQLHRGSSPLQLRQQNQNQNQNQPGKQQQAVQQCQHYTPLPQGKSAYRPSVQPQLNPQSPALTSRHSSPTPEAERPTSGKRQIDRAISAQEWKGFAVAARLNGQDEGKARQPVFGPSLQMDQSNAISPTPPQYLLLPEAESYDSFMLLAHAFRQWHSHASSEQLFRYAEEQLVHFYPLLSSGKLFCAVHVVFACHHLSHTMWDMCIKCMGNDPEKHSTACNADILHSYALLLQFLI